MRLSCGFTLLETLGSVLVLGILIAIAVPVVAGFKERADMFACAANMRSLYSGAAAYVQEHQNWPQIAPSAQDGGSFSRMENRSVASQWIEALKPYGISSQTWRCPSIERLMRTKGKEGAVEKERIDYTPTRFGTGPLSPYQWATHPWFIEVGAGHGGGPQIILTDGSVLSVQDVMRQVGR